MPRKNKPAAKKTASSKSTDKKYTSVPPTTGIKSTKKKSENVVSPSMIDASTVSKDTSPAVQENVAPTTVAKSNDVAALNSLITALNDVNADVARDAATSLGALGDASAVEPLIAIVSNANGYFHAVVRSAAAASLGQLKDRRAIDALLSAVYDPIAEPSIEAIRALAGLGDRQAVSALIEVVRNRSGFFVNSVRRAAVLGLIKLGGEEAHAELGLVSSNGWEDSVIREEATAAFTAH